MCCPGTGTIDASLVFIIIRPFMNRNPHVAVVGATGAVGIEMIKTLEKRGFPVGKRTLLASASRPQQALSKRFHFDGLAAYFG